MPAPFCKGDVMNDINCPFDGQACENKQNCFDELKTFAFRNPELVASNLSGLFSGCPIKSELERQDICKRYHNYLLTLSKAHESR